MNFFFFRADTECEGTGKLTGRDKAVLGWVWLLSFVYGIMCDQLLSKVVDRPCSVRNTRYIKKNKEKHVGEVFLWKTIEQYTQKVSVVVDCNLEFQCCRT